MSLGDIIDWVEENPQDAAIRIFALERENIILERENAALRKQIAALGEIACLNLDDATVAKCDAVTGGEKYKDVLRRLFVEHPKEIAELRSLLREAITSLAQHRAALAKEGQRCQCTNGVIRSVGRDNDEVIEDCPNCSGSKEAKP